MPGRLWTTGEIRLLREWRTAVPPVPYKVCAKRLGRSLSAVQRQLWRQGVVVRRTPAETTARLVGRYARLGRTDAWIGLKIGKTARTVRSYRTKLGIPATPNNKFRLRAVCDSCRAMCPIPVAAGWKKMSGWVCRRTKFSSWEVYCGKCFEEYGWVEADYHGHAVNAVVRPQDKPVYRHPAVAYH